MSEREGRLHDAQVLGTNHLVEHRRPYYEQIFARNLDEEWDAAPGKDVIVAALGALSEAGRIAPDARVLDIACGTGFLLERIREEVSPGWRLVGIDFSGTAVAAGKRRRPDRDLVVGDGMATGFADAAFDVVVNYGSMEHFPDPARSVTEAARILSPGGVFLMMVPALDHYRQDRDDEGWYPDLTGQPQWNLRRGTWASMFSASGLDLWPLSEATRYGAKKPGVFFFGARAAPASQ